MDQMGLVQPTAVLAKQSLSKLRAESRRGARSSLLGCGG